MESSKDPQELGRKCVEDMDRVLADYPSLMHTIVKLNPDGIAPQFPHESGVSVAAVCLRDCQTALGQAIYAFHQACDEGERHRQRSHEPGDQMMAVWVERFYLEDVAMRLYNAAEHLAGAVAMFRQLDGTALRKLRGSQWERVRQTLASQFSADPIVSGMEALRNDTSWQFAIKYRGDVVHDQPPMVEGLGVLYERRQRWKRQTDGRWTLHVRSTGDAARHTVSEVRNKMLSAAAGFLQVLSTVVGEYLSLLQAHGISETENGISLRIG